MATNPLIARWNVLSGIATPVCTCIGGFLLLPPLDVNGDAGSKFGIFLATLLVGLWLVPIRLYSTRRALPLWLVAAVAFTVLSASGYFLYNRTMDRWAFDYSGKLVIAGSHLSKKAGDTRDAWLKQGRSVTNHDLLWHFDGAIADVWPDTQERTRRVNILLELYLADLLVMASAIVTVVQASYCATKSKRKAAH